MNVFKQAFGLSGSLGIFLGALSLLNLTAIAFNLGLSVFWERVLGYWRALVHDTIFAIVAPLLPFNLPLWMRDPIVLWIIFAGMCFRTLMQARHLALQARKNAGNRGDEAWEGVGLLERQIFAWPLVGYAVTVALFCLLVWPVAAVRFIWNRPMHFYSPKFQFGLAFQDMMQKYDYRTIALSQLSVLLLTYLIMLATNAGLPTAPTVP